MSLYDAPLHSVPPPCHGGRYYFLTTARASTNLGRWRCAGPEPSRGPSSAGFVTGRLQRRPGTPFTVDLELAGDSRGKERYKKGEHFHDHFYTMGWII